MLQARSILSLFSKPALGCGSKAPIKLVKNIPKNCLNQHHVLKVEQQSFFRRFYCLPYSGYELRPRIPHTNRYEKFKAKQKLLQDHRETLWIQKQEKITYSQQVFEAIKYPKTLDLIPLLELHAKYSPFEQFDDWWKRFMQLPGPRMPDHYLLRMKAASLHDNWAAFDDCWDAFKRSMKRYKRKAVNITIAVIFLPWMSTHDQEKLAEMIHDAHRDLELKMSNAFVLKWFAVVFDRWTLTKEAELLPVTLQVIKTQKKPHHPSPNSADIHFNYETVLKIIHFVESTHIFLSNPSLRAILLRMKTYLLGRGLTKCRPFYFLTNSHYPWLPLKSSKSVGGNWLGEIEEEHIGTAPPELELSAFCIEPESESSKDPAELQCVFLYYVLHMDMEKVTKLTKQLDPKAFNYGTAREARLLSCVDANLRDLVWGFFFGVPGKSFSILDTLKNLELFSQNSGEENNPALELIANIKKQQCQFPMLINVETSVTSTDWMAYINSCIVHQNVPYLIRLRRGLITYHDFPITFYDAFCYTFLELRRDEAFQAIEEVCARHSMLIYSYHLTVASKKKNGVSPTAIGSSEAIAYSLLKDYSDPHVQLGMMFLRKYQSKYVATLESAMDNLESNPLPLYSLVERRCVRQMPLFFPLTWSFVELVTKKLYRLDPPAQIEKEIKAWVDKADKCPTPQSPLNVIETVGFIHAMEKWRDVLRYKGWKPSKIQIK